jgi:hypothetical protein
VLGTHIYTVNSWVGAELFHQHTTIDADSSLALNVYGKCNWVHRKEADGEKAPTVSSSS